GDGAPLSCLQSSIGATPDGGDGDAGVHEAVSEPFVVPRSLPKSVAVESSACRCYREGATCGVGTPGARSAHLDGRTDERAVLGPRAVVVLDVRVPEQLLEREPRVGGALADPAVRDDLTVAGDALGVVQRLELVGGLEGAVVHRRLSPPDVRGAGDVARHLRLLLRKVDRCELLAAELLRRAHVDEPRGAERRDDLVAHRADLRTLLSEEHVLGARVARHVAHELPALELPL